MMVDPDALAPKYGISSEYMGTDGVKRVVPHETKVKLLAALGIQQAQSDDAKILGEIPPEQLPRNHKCYLPSWLAKTRVWGVSLQLYELRSERNWGIGDFADLRSVVETVAKRGADFIGLNPLHALFLSDPARNSPFSPSNRGYLNPVYITVPAVFGYKPEVDELRIAESLRQGDLVDYGAVVALKLQALQRCWRVWRRTSATSSAEFHSFELFKAEGGSELRSHALFETLSLHMVRSGYDAGWSTWPIAYRSRHSADVEEFAVCHASELEFHTWLQWLAAGQLDSVKAAADAAGMRIGLYLDFAVGEAPDGSATWINGQDYVQGFKVGAPPDVFSSTGQDWGLAARAPPMLEAAMESYSALFKEATQHGGALRIDHAMSLRQLFLVPDGEPPSSGTYVQYPTQQLLQHLSDASEKNCCLVIGEDLGNVPEGFRDEMQNAQILSYRVLYFEKEQTRFLPPADYPDLAFACLSTHDLPTLAAWWVCDDIRLRLQHGLIDEELAEIQMQERLVERGALLDVLLDSDLIKQAAYAAFALRLGEIAFPLPDVVSAATHRLIAQTPSILAGIRFADLTGETKPTNLPGTDSSQYPNWRQKSSILLENLSGDDRFRAIVAAVAAERPR
jgi:4-alpha-glucanotransferase